MRNLILGTDWGEDCDDAVAVRILARYAKAGKINLSAIGINTHTEYSAPSLYAFLEKEGNDFLERLAHRLGAQRIATAHHMADQAETVLLNLLRGTGAVKIGTAGPPPGLSVTETRETVERLSLRRGETLILFSDGVDAPGALRREGVSSQASAGELAARLLPAAGEVGDDATVAVVRLSPAALST